MAIPSVVPTSQSAKINQKPQPIFVTEKIADPIVRHNFDILNKQLQKMQQNRQPPKANIVFSPILYTQQLITSLVGNLPIAPLSVPITTRGNPVTVRLMAAPQPLATGGLASFFILSSLSTLSWAYGGWQRNGVQISQQLIKLNVSTGAVPEVSRVTIWLPLPIFEFTDNKVPTGTYRYQFTLSLVSGTTVALQNVQVVAKEET